MSHKFLFILFTISALVIASSAFVSTVSAKANLEHSNNVAGGANTNGPYMKSCKQVERAKDCATGPGNNGEFTSGLAHDTNKP